MSYIKSVRLGGQVSSSIRVLTDAARGGDFTFSPSFPDSIPPLTLGQGPPGFALKSFTLNLSLGSSPESGRGVLLRFFSLSSVPQCTGGAFLSELKSPYMVAIQKHYSQVFDNLGGSFST
ncbi:hypothetical protein TNCT_632471 [Trichonephila clavata]|uniref:Uncharacterized protein n=1 Tax=Trichonephila clavata TaxID=2740835 RepID=A0A8X6KRM7_TRICU|nr:hypothetical protein TNCT_632471 [Trichonephila clavata]